MIRVTQLSTSLLSLQHERGGHHGGHCAYYRAQMMLSRRRSSSSIATMSQLPMLTRNVAVRQHHEGAVDLFVV
jgi:hypothetical protein